MVQNDGVAIRYQQELYYLLLEALEEIINCQFQAIIWEARSKKLGPTRMYHARMYERQLNGMKQ